MYVAFGLEKTKGSLKPFLHTRPWNFWLCLPIFNVYSRRSLQKNHSNDFSSCLNDSLGILENPCQMAA